MSAAGTAPRTLRVEHETRYEYDAEVELARHLAHLRPRDTPWQRVRRWRLDIDPPPDPHPGAPGTPDNAHPPGVSLSQDVWGNWRSVFSHSKVHDQLSVRSVFVVELRPRPALVPADSPAWETVARSLCYRAGTTCETATEFALPSAYAPRDPALAEYGRASFTPGRPLLEAAVDLMRRVHRDFEYAPDATSVSTRAPEALSQHKGVCQDFAHVMIGAMRNLGLAARYVSGYLLTRPPPGQPRLVGADATHAWVEAWCPAQGWVGLDPTNDIPADLDHVTVAWGRDYADVAPLRGVIRGGGHVEPSVAVTVEPLEGA
ncbi:MAG: transglutaminase domain-containing protein [Gammaproteobacteria bacterium]|jgi:transglutaminase-like putative cysteine protease